MGGRTLTEEVPGKYTYYCYSFLFVSFCSVVGVVLFNTFFIFIIYVFIFLISSFFYFILHFCCVVLFLVFVLFYHFNVFYVLPFSFFF